MDDQAYPTDVLWAWMQYIVDAYAEISRLLKEVCDH